VRRMAASRTAGVGDRDRARRSLEEVNLPQMNMARGRTLHVVDLVRQTARRAWRRIKQQRERRVSRKAGEAMLVAAGLPGSRASWLVDSGLRPHL